MGIEEAKKAAGRKAAELIQDGLVVGLGSGSTAAYFIEALIERCKQGLKIEAVASSNASASQAKKGGLRLVDINSTLHIDLTVDGADEIDPQKRMIKGGGGAHVREKILAAASRELIVIVDETKLVASLGACKLPVEILFYGSPSTRKKLEQAGYRGKWRVTKDSQFFITDNGNLILDIQFDSPPLFPEMDHEKIIQIPGVVDTGFFFQMAGRVIVGFPNGTTEIR